MKAGYPMTMLWGDNNSIQLHFEKLPNETGKG
jgi:hypothetical protein